jgi:hypothetical protein
LRTIVALIITTLLSCAIIYVNRISIVEENITDSGKSTYSRLVHHGSDHDRHHHLDESHLVNRMTLQDHVVYRWVEIAAEW